VLANRNFRFVKLRADLLLAEPRAGEALVNRLKERGLRMVVEKVEDEDALIEVMEFGIDCDQGYLLGGPRDRKGVVSGTSVAVRVDLGGCRRIKKKKKIK